jgi:mono/diheme cytochrome c family protein
MRLIGRERGAAWNVFFPAVGALAAFSLFVGAALAEDADVARGKYLVTFGSCTDCHTSGHFLGKPDMAKFLGGSDVGFAVPGLGVFVGRNLTPDKETGLGLWTRDQIATAVTTGVRPDGRVLAPTMPWRAYAQLTRTDALAIAAYLQSLPPVKHAVPGPFGSNDNVSVSVMLVLPPTVYNDLQRSPSGQSGPSK